MKTLIINGSPRVNGNTAALIAELKKHMERMETSSFYSMHRRIFFHSDKARRVH